MHKLVLIRHGESTWNKENRFTGWTDVDLSTKGVEEAHAAGRALREAGFTFDVAYTSVLKRAIRTLWITLDEMDLMWIPVHRSWRLNERHYGALQGLNKAEMAAKFGEAQVKIWRRSYDVQPPALETTDERFPAATGATRAWRARSCRAPSASRTRSPASCRCGTRPSPRPSARASAWSSPPTATACAPWSSTWTTSARRTSSS